MIRRKRAYDKPSASDGYRVLVDRVWPRGVLKQAARIDAWMREVAPSARLRQWFGHEPAKWDELRRRYWKELQAKEADLSRLVELSRKKVPTLVFAARDVEHNNAVALRDYLLRASRRG